MGCSENEEIELTLDDVVSVTRRNVKSSVDLVNYHYACRLPTGDVSEIQVLVDCWGGNAQAIISTTCTMDQNVNVDNDMFGADVVRREIEAANLTIDQIILSEPCSLCDAVAGEHCNYRGQKPAPVENPEPDGQRFYYHAERTDVGAWTYNLVQQHAARLTEGE